MPTFICTVCGKEVAYPTPDEYFYEDRCWQCIACYLTIAHAKYPKIPGGQTYFAMLDEFNRLGDRIWINTLFEYYRQQNPEETVILTTTNQFSLLLEGHLHYDKLFWPNMLHHTFMPRNPQHPNQPAKNVFLFNVAAELTWLIEHTNIRLSPGFMAEPPPNIPVSPYLVLHLRHYDMPEKNVTFEELYRLLLVLKKYPGVGEIILVGNDAQVYTDADLREHLWPAFTDLRKQLTLPQILWLIEHAALYIGKDSGITQLAACAQTPILAWNFETADWFPKVTPETATFCFLKAQPFSEVMGQLEKVLMAMGGTGVK